MDSNNEVPTKAASPTSDYQMGNPNSTNIAGFHQSDTLFPRMPLPSSEGRSNHYKTCMHALSMSWQNHNSAFTLRELWTATMKYQQRQPALPQITTWAIQTAQTSQDFINRTHFSLECHCLHQKADQTTIKPVCMHCPCLGKTTTLHLRYVSYGQQQWSTNKGRLPYLRLPDGQSKQHKHRRISSIGHTFPSNATAFIRRQIKPL